MRVNNNFKSQIVADTSTGEVKLLLSEHNFFKKDFRQFTKLYITGYDIIKTLKPNELAVFIFIAYNIKMNRKSITLHSSLFQFSKKKYYTIIKALIQKNVITRATNQFGKNADNLYYVNTDLVFNGKY